MPVRLIRPDDLIGVFAIYDREVLEGTHTFETVVKTPAERQAWLAAHQTDRYACFVAEEAGRIAGWAGLSAWSPRQAYVRTAETSVYVAPSAMGRGVGRALMDALLAHTREAGLVKVLVARIVQPNDASNRLHERLGFREFGLMRRCGEKFGRILDVRLMDLHLD